MTTVSFPPAAGCFEDVPEGFESFRIECIAEEELRAEDYRSGGRIVYVTPYRKGSQIYPGQYGQFQVLSGHGGQIHRALYLGCGVGRDDSSLLPSKINVPERTDCAPLKGPTEVDGGSDGDRALAIRERGRWYVVQAGGGATTNEILVSIIGGNTLAGSGGPGVKYVDEPVSGETQNDPQVAETTVDGVGIAYIWINGVQQFTTDEEGAQVPLRVFVVNDPRGVIRQALVGNAEGGEWAAAFEQQVTIGTDGEGEPIRAYNLKFH